MMLHEYIHDNNIIELPFSTASTTPFSISVPALGSGFPTGEMVAMITVLQRPPRASCNSRVLGRSADRWPVGGYTLGVIL